MKKLIAITAVILFGCLFISSFSATQRTENMTEQAIIYNEKKAYDKNDEINQVYVIKSEDGELVVYKKGETSPLIHTGTLVKGLPKGDIMRLEKGIEITGKDNLKKYIEDYCS